MADDPGKVAEALRLGRRAAHISRQNPLVSVLPLTLLIPSAVVGFLTVVAAVIVHECPSWSPSATACAPAVRRPRACDRGRGTGGGASAPRGGFARFIIISETDR